MSLSSILVPSSGCLFGGYRGSSCDSSTNLATRIRNFETLIGRTATTNGILDIAHSYEDFPAYTGGTFPSVQEKDLADEGRLLLINWTPRIFGSSTIFRWPDITAGTYDSSYIIPTAQAMADWGKPFFLAFHTEPESDSSDHSPPGNYGTDAQYAAAAAHVHDVFVAQGCTNAVWVFNLAGFNSTSSRWSTLYPGDTKVDWIGFDPYGSTSTGDTFDSVLSTKYPVYNWATATKSGSHTKPQMLLEWGKKETSAGTGATSKAGFFDAVRTNMAGNYPLIKAIVYFDATSTVSECLNTSTAAVSAFSTLAGDAYFNPDVSPAPPPVGQGAFRAGAATAFSNSASNGIVVPATVQAGDGMLLWHTSTRTGLKNACEGTNTVAISTGNSNSAGSNPLDNVGGTAPTYATAQSHSGSSSWLCSVSAGTDSHGDYRSSFGSPATNAPYYGRLYVRPTSNPPVIARIFQQQSAANANQWGLALDTSGNLIVRDLAAGATRLTVAGGALALNTWHRVEWKAVWNGSTTTVDVRLYRDAVGDELTLDNSGTSTAFTVAAAPGFYNFGLHVSTSQTWSFNLDDIGLDFNTWLGPAGTSAVLTDPTGWVSADKHHLAAGAGELQSNLYRKTAAAGDPGSTLTLATDVNAHGSILLLAYSGVDQLALIDVEGTSDKSTDSTTVVTPNQTTTGANEWVISAAFQRDNPGGLATTWTLPGGEGQRAASFPSGTTDGRVAGVATDDGVAHGVGTYGTKTYTSDRTSYLGIGFTVAVKSTAAVSSGQGLGMLQTHN